uniref:Uncharacterized protein n=2 Tax=Meloidogyne TaxID=189290 RepID=A0A6V7X121_MELEN|nr:unnamed protein product [Meloidogyne enterolobii]
MTPKRHLIDLALLISYRQIIKVFFREKTKSCLRHRHHSGLSGGGANNVRENDVRKNKILKRHQYMRRNYSWRNPTKIVVLDNLDGEKTEKKDKIIEQLNNIEFLKVFFLIL